MISAVKEEVGTISGVSIINLDHYLLFPCQSDKFRILSTIETYFAGEKLSNVTTGIPIDIESSNEIHTFIVNRLEKHNKMSGYYTAIIFFITVSQLD